MHCPRESCTGTSIAPREEGDDLTVRLHPDQRAGLRRAADAWGMAP